MLEFAADPKVNQAYPWQFRQVNKTFPVIIDWAPLFAELIRDRDKGTAAAACAGKFHNSLVNIMVTVAKKAGQEKVCLSGGCFQNALLLEKAINALQATGCRVYWHQRVPPNDGGIALGQVYAK